MKNKKAGSQDPWKELHPTYVFYLVALPNQTFLFQIFGNLLYVDPV
jgi:hypothetical protein